MLYTKDENDEAQLWRAMYAGKYGEHTLYWLNCMLGGMKEPFALDRFTGALRNNADVYKSMNSSAQDQLLYFTEVGDTGRVYIHLYDKYNSQDNPADLVLTAAPNPNGVNGNNSPTSLTQAGNVYWSEYADGNPGQRWVVETKIEGESPYTIARATDFPYDKYYQHDANIFYPSFVGECTWYCNGRFLEVNETSNFCTGNAVSWATAELPSKLGRDTELREQSIAVFGPKDAADKRTAGHVVLIEYFNGDDVVFSECNYLATISNREIEVRNSLLPKAVDGYRQSKSRTEFKSLYGYEFLCVIYKNTV